MTLLAILMVVLVTSLTTWNATAQSRPGLAWTAPAQMRRTAWVPDGELPAPVPAGDPAATQRLEGDQLILVPAVGGDIVRFAGERVRVGIGSGFGASLDSIVWLHDEVTSQGGDVRLPNWGTPRFFVAMAKPGAVGWVKLWLAARKDDPMVWYRLDEAVARWIRDPTLDAPVPAYPAEDATPIIHWLGEARKVVSDERCSPMMSDYLLARWVADSARVRPLQRPFFAPVSVTVHGGKTGSIPRAARDEVKAQHRFVAASETMTIAAPNADVLSLAVRVRSVERTVIRLYEGDSLAQELTIVTPLQAFAAERWSPARLVRLVVPDGANLSVEVARGEASVSVKGYRRQSSVLDLYGLRSRDARLMPVPPASCTGTDAQTLSAAVSAEKQRTAKAIRYLAMLAGAERLTHGQRTLLLHEALRLGAGTSNLQAWFDALWAESATLGARMRAVMRRSALEAITATRTPELDGLVVPQDDSLQSPEVPTDETIALAALTGAAAHPEAQTRVTAAEDAERFAAAGSLQRRWMDLSRETWRRAAPWSNLKPEAALSAVVLHVRVEPDEPGNPTCAVSGPMGTRWMQLETDDVLDVAPRGGTHTLVSFAGDPSREPADVTIRIDGIPVVVHAGAGLRASAAVRPGKRRFSGAGLERLFARVPTNTNLPCEKLREAVRWSVVRHEGVFGLPAGAAMTVASVIVSDEWLQKPVKVHVGVGGVVYEGWVRRRSTGALEVPVPPGVTSIRVRTDSPQLVRVRARLSPESHGSRSRGEAAIALEAPTKEDRIERVRAATRALRRAATEKAAAEARVERIKWLELLGYGSYAAADRTRLPAGVTAPKPRQTKTWSYAAELPPGSPAVVPLGALPRIVALPSPKARDAANTLMTLVETLAKGEPKDGVLTRLAALSRRSSSVDALLLGVLAQENGDSATAAAAFERIGRKHRSGVALGRAARLRADMAYALGNVDEALDAYILARDAFEIDGSATDTLNRLSEAIEWQDVVPERSAGDAYVYTRSGTRRKPPLGSSVRRALLDPPSGAAVTEARPISVTVKRFEYPTAKVDAGCHALDGADERCSIEFEVDGKRTQCLSKADWDAGLGEGQPRGEHGSLTSPENRASSVPALASLVATTESCYVALPPDAKRLTVVPPPKRRTLLWAAISSVASPGSRTEAPAESKVEWLEVDDSQGVRVAVLGPTVLKVTATSLAGEAPKLEVHARRATGKAHGERRELALSREASGREFLHPSRAPLSEPTLDYLTLHRSGQHEITLKTDHGRAWVRLAMASTLGLPKPAKVDAPLSTAPKEPKARSELPSSFPYYVGWAEADLPLSVTAELRYSNEDLGEEDDTPLDDSERLSVTVRRAIPSLDVWLRGTLATRLREGPDTLGTRLDVNRAPAGILPGIDLLGRLAYQRFDSTPALGWLASASLHKPFPLGSTTSVEPGLTMTYRHVDYDANHEAGADNEVFSLYSARRPRSLDIALPLYHRPWLDMLNSYEFEARTLPDFDGFDALQAAAQTRLMAGSGYAPLVRLRLVTSYRLRSILRRGAFLRTSLSPSVMFWHWFGPMGRVTLQADVSYFVDRPEGAGASSQVSGFLSLGLDLVGGRGLLDFTPSEKPFTERMEEDAEPFARSQRGLTPYWESKR